jgi:hypothetical protein
MKINKIIEDLYKDSNGIVLVDDIEKDFNGSRQTLMKEIKKWISQNENTKLIIGRRGGRSRIEIGGSLNIKKEPSKRTEEEVESIAKAKPKKEEDFYNVKNNLSEKNIPWDKRFAAVPVEIRGFRTTFTVPLDISKAEWETLITSMKKSLRRKEVLTW